MAKTKPKKSKTAGTADKSKAKAKKTTKAKANKTEAVDVDKEIEVDEEIEVAKETKSKKTKVVFIKSPTGLFKMAYGIKDVVEFSDKALIESLLSAKVASTDLEYFTREDSTKSK